MTKTRILIGTVWAMIATSAVWAQNNGASEAQFQAAQHKEQVDGDLRSAIQLYQQVADSKDSSRAMAAQALLRVGRCYEKLGSQEGRKAYERVVRQYGDQLQLANEARSRLAADAGRSPGAPVPVLRQLTTNSAELPLAAAAISPDGKHLAYADPAGLHLKLLKTGETHALPLPAELTIASVAWFPNNSELVVSGVAKPGGEYAIWKISLQNGAPRKLRNDGAGAVVSPDGSQIAFLTGFEQLWLMGADGNNPHAIVTGKPGEKLAANQWLPSGERIGYAAIYQGVTDASGKTPLHIDLCSIDRQGNNPIRLAFDPGATGGLFVPGPRLLYAVQQSPIADWTETYLWDWKIDLSTQTPSTKPQRLSSFGRGVSPIDFSATADGRQLVFLKGEPQSDVYVAELEQDGKALRDTRRLTLDDHNDTPTGWSLDSRSVFFISDRNGSQDIFRQSIDSQVAETIVATPRDKGGPVLHPDGGSFFYPVMPEGWRSTASRPISWMRMPVSGGAARDVFGTPLPIDIKCSLPPAGVCVAVEHKGNEVIVWSFDPDKGKVGELARTTVGPRNGGRNGISPDGSRVAVAMPDRIRILTLRANQSGAGEFRDILAPGWSGFHWVSWAPNGKGLYVACWPNGRTVIAYMDFEGHISTLSDQPGQFDTEVYPSPDGKRVAFELQSSANNAWMMERF